MGSVTGIDLEFYGEFDPGTFPLELSPGDVVPAMVTITPFVGAHLASSYSVTKLPGQIAPVINGTVYGQPLVFDIHTSVTPADVGAVAMSGPDVFAEAFTLVSDDNVREYRNASGDGVGFAAFSVDAFLTVTYAYNPISEPTSIAVLTIGIIGLIAAGRRLRD